MNEIKKSPEVKYLSAEEIKLFFAAVKHHPRDHLIFKWMYLYGLRVSECINLKLTDILPSPEVPKEIFISRLKSGISRHYPIRSADTIHLKRWLRKRSKMRNTRDNTWLFPTSHSVLHHMSSPNVLKLIQKYGAQIGLPKEKRHPHIFRHSCAISLLMKGSDIYDVQSYLGHRSVLTTIKYYGTFGFRDWTERAKNQLENGFFV